MRKFLAVIFLTIFSLQVLPLKAIGKLLNSGENTEEVQHSDDCSDDVPGGKIIKFGDDMVQPHYQSFNLFASRQAFNNKISVFIHTAESLPSVHIAAMPSPPPDNC